MHRYEEQRESAGKPQCHCSPARTRCRLPAILLLKNLLLTGLLLTFPPLGIGAAPQPASRLLHCFDEIDQATQAFEIGRADQARERLSLLNQSCADIPHLHHNLGTLALLEKNWNEAIRQFEKSLSLDARAAMTQQTLASVYQYQASLAYRKALDLSGPEPRTPQIRMQTSSLRNSEHFPTAGDLVAPLAPGQPVQFAESGTQDLRAEVLFDVASWWQAQQQHDLTAYFAYYRDGVYPLHFDSADKWKDTWKAAWNSRWVSQPPADNNRLPDWSEVNYTAEPLDHYMLVNLHYQQAAVDPKLSTGHATDTPASATPVDQHVMLVLQKKQQLWQIIKEKIW